MTQRRLSDAKREAAVDRSGITRRRRQPLLLHIVDTAARIYGTSIALVSIIDRRQEIFAARVGTDIETVPKEDAICLYAVRHPGEPTFALDASSDKRFAQNPFVCGPPFVRFYAGGAAY